MPRSMTGALCASSSNVANWASGHRRAHTFFSAIRVASAVVFGCEQRVLSLSYGMLRLFVFLATTALGCAGATADPALRLMHGAWIGDGHYFLLDTQRMQANLDIKKPFQRDPLMIRNITGSMVIFQIKNHRFIGLFDGPNLRITGHGIQDSAILRRAVRP